MKDLLLNPMHVFKPASREDIEASAHQGADQPKASRQLINVTLAHRHLAKRQFQVQHLAYWLTVLGLLVTELSSPHLPRSTLVTWVTAAFAIWFVRTVLFERVTSVPTEDVRQSRLLKLIPVLMVLIASAFWVWTIWLFSGPAMSVRQIFLVIGLISISLAMTGMWPVTPVAVIIYVSSLWVGFSVNLYTLGLANIVELVLIDLAILTVLWVYTYIAVHQLNAQLEDSREMSKVVAELAAAKRSEEKLKKTAYETLDTRSEFFRHASHDFQQRLHAAKMWVLAGMATHENGEPVAPVLERLGDEISSLQVYVNKVLDFARMETLAEAPRLKPVEIQSLFQELDLQFERLTVETETQLKFRLTNDVIETDAAMLLRILENLISNALKFTRDKVLVCARRRRGEIWLEIWDRGPGIEPAAYVKIFEAFHQEANAETARTKGVGLGLAIVRRFAALLEYRVIVRSAVGRGTVFRLVIPQAMK